MMEKLNYNSLSDAGQSRKQTMLTDLQKELVLSQNRKRSLKSTAVLTAAACLIATVFFFFNLTQTQESTTANSVAFSGSKSHSIGATLGAPTFGKFIETNRSDVVTQYVDSRDTAQLSFTMLNDQELNDLLRSTGDKMVLGEIGGKQVLIPAKLAP